MPVDVEKWLGAAPLTSGAWRPALPAKPCAGNSVKYFIQLMDYYVDLGNSIRATRTNIADFVYIAGWGLDLDTFVDPPGGNRKTILDVLMEAARRKVDIRVLLTEGLDQKTNANTLKTLGQLLPGFDGLTDPVHQLAGVHHEKIVIIRNAAGVIAYCGSNDIDNIRLGRLANDGPKAGEGPLASSPWQEVVARWEGPVVRDIWNGYCLRYQGAKVGLPGIQNNPGARAIAEKILPAPLQPNGPTLTGRDGDAGLYWPSGQYQSGGVVARMVRTLPNGQRQRPTNFNFGNLTAYDFARAGEHSYYDVVSNAIRKTTRYLYMEDQYFFFGASTVLGKSIAELLAELVAKPSFQKLIALVAGPGTVQDETMQGGTRRRDLLQTIGLGQGKVEVYVYNDNIGSPYWMHSKMWIFDDELAVVGSANLNRRGYTSDVEMGVAFCSTEIDDRANIVKQLRIDLWQKHLEAFPLKADQSPRPGKRLRTDKTMLSDFMGASGLWRDAPLLVRVDGDLLAHPLPDIDLVKAKTDSLPNRYYRRAAKALANTMLTGRDRQWDYALDPDGG